MEIPNAGISWLYTAGFISSSADMEKNMSSYSPYEKCDVGKGRKQSSSPCSVATAWLSCPEMRKQSQQEELPRNGSEDGQEHVPRTQHGWGFLGTLGGREKVKPRGSQLAVTPALAVWRFLIEVTWLHGFWRAVRGQLQLRWRWNTKTGKYWACRVCDCLSEQGLVGEKIGAGLLEVLSLKGLCCRYLTVSAQTAWLLFALTSVCVVPPSVTQKVLSGCAYHRLWGLICSVSPTHHVWFHPWARLGHAGWTSLGVIEPDAVLQAPLSNALPLLIGLQKVLLGCSKTPAVWARGPEHPLFHSSRPGLAGSHHSLGQTRISAERML